MITVHRNHASYEVYIAYSPDWWIVSIYCEDRLENKISIAVEMGIRGTIKAIYQTIDNIDWYKYLDSHAEYSAWGA